MDVIARDVLVIGITSNKQQETAKKTREYLRRLSHKLPIGNLKAAESYRHLIVIELVCRSLRIQFDRQKLLSLVTNNSNHKNNNANDSNSNSNSSKKNSRNPLLTDYQKNYNMCKNLLQINYDKVSAMDYLCIAYGHELRKKAEEILETFRRVYVEKELSEYDKNSINLELPIFQSAAFYIAAKLEKVNIDKNKVIDYAETDVRTFNKTVELVLKAEKSGEVHTERTIDSTCTSSSGNKIQMIRNGNVYQQKQQNNFSERKSFLVGDNDFITIANHPDDTLLKKTSIDTSNSLVYKQQHVVLQEKNRSIEQDNSIPLCVQAPSDQRILDSKDELADLKRKKYEDWKESLLAEKRSKLSID